MDPSQMSSNPKHKAVVWVVVIIVLVAVAATFFALRYKSLKSFPESGGTAAGTPTKEPAAASTSVGAIEKDLNAVPLDNLDSELNNISAELAK